MSHCLRRRSIEPFPLVSNQPDIYGVKLQFRVMSSNPEFMGDYDKIIEVEGLGQRTIDIRNLEVPQTAQPDSVIRLTVSVTKQQLGGVQSPVFGEDMVQSVLRFRVGAPPMDADRPVVEADYDEACHVAANDTMCDQHQWFMTFNVKVELILN